MLLAEAERRVDAQVRLRLVQPQPAATAAPVTAAPPPQRAFPLAHLNVQPERNRRHTNISSDPGRVVGSISHPLWAARQSSPDNRAGNSSRHEPSWERGSSPFVVHGTRSSQGRGGVAEQGSSRGYPSHQQAKEKPRDNYRQTRVKEMMERLRSNHDCNPHDWRKKHGGGECSECHHHLPLYLLVSTSVFI
jgi:hypothetical protein